MSKKISLIKPDPENYRLHPENNQALIRQSLKEVGPFRSIAVDGDDIIRAGNGVYEQAQALGLKLKIIDAQPDELIAVRRKDLRGRKAVRAGLYDNRSQETSIWDTGKLSNAFRNDEELIKGIFEAQRSVEDTLAEHVEGPSSPEKPEKVLDDLQAKWKVSKGLLFEAVSTKHNVVHYVICDDCRKPIKIKLGPIGGIFTSPPYAEQRKKQYGGIPETKYVEWWTDIQAAARKYLEGTRSSFFVNIKPHATEGQRSLYVMDLVIAMARQWGWRYIEEYCWLKQKMPGKDKFRFRNAFEPVYQFSTHEQPAIYHEQNARIGETFMFKDTALSEKFDGSSVLEQTIGGIPGNILPSNVVVGYNSKGIHPATFPGKLVDYFVQGFSREGEVWIDLFAGSGTTLVQCEKLNRCSVGFEVQPRYVALILQNLEDEGCKITVCKKA